MICDRCGDNTKSVKLTIDADHNTHIARTERHLCSECYSSFRRWWYETTGMLVVLVEDKGEKE